MDIKATKSSIITSLLVMLAVGIAIGIYVLNPPEKTVEKNEPIATETPVATESTFSEFEATATPDAIVIK